MTMNATPQNFGPDDAGLICGYLFRSDGMAKAITSRDALTWLDNQIAEPANIPLAATQEFLWLHFSLVHANATKFGVAGRVLRHDGRRPAFIAH
jgi:hypothetical protein